MMIYRNRKVELKVYNFLSNLPNNVLNFPFDVNSSIKYVPNCVIRSYQTVATRRNVSLNDIIAYCESNTGCTHSYNGKYIIMFNDLKSMIDQRKTFTLAHELGHIILEHPFEKNNSLFSQNSTINKALEREANHFAACLLCPTPIIYKIKPKSILDIQTFFDVSYETAGIAWNDYINYDRNYHISWHNDMVRLFF